MAMKLNKTPKTIGIRNTPRLWDNMNSIKGTLLCNGYTNVSLNNVIEVALNTLHENTDSELMSAFINYYKEEDQEQ